MLSMVPLEQTPSVASVNGSISSSLKHDVSLPETLTIIPHITTDAIYFQAVVAQTNDSPD